MKLVRAAAAVAAAMMAAGCYDSFGGTAGTDFDDTEKAGITISSLTAMYRGSTVEITENLIISGRVTSSDRAGNFYRSMTVEQDGAAVEIMAGVTDLHNIWPVGSGVSVRLQGLALGENYGVKCIGMPPDEYSYLTVGYIPSRVELDSRITRTHGPEPFGIENFRAAMLDRTMCGRIVRVVSLAATDEAAEDAADEAAEESVAAGAGERTWGGYNVFEDRDDGVRIAVYVSSYADFARQPVPQGAAVAVAGILQYGRPDGCDGDMFILKPRDEEDIMLY